MPHYFIDTIDRSVRRDETGEDLPDLAAVRRRACRVLADMVLDDPDERSTLQLVASVRDERGRCVATASLLMVVEEAG